MLSHGTVDFYLLDEEDPLIKMYGRVYPGLFKPITAMPRGLQEHLRYPEELFPTADKGLWSLSHAQPHRLLQSGGPVGAGPGGGLGPRTGYEPLLRHHAARRGGGGRIRPDDALHPARRNNMVAWMAARCDGDKYGQILVYRFPKQALTYRPAQIEARIDQDTFISQQLTLWSQTGSQAVRGNLLVIPIRGLFALCGTAILAGRAKPAA